MNDGFNSDPATMDDGDEDPYDSPTTISASEPTPGIIFAASAAEPQAPQEPTDDSQVSAAGVAAAGAAAAGAAVAKPAKRRSKKIKSGK